MHKPVTSLLARWAIAFGQRDPAQLALLYTPEALFYGSSPTLNRGRAAIEKYFAPLLAKRTAHAEFTKVEEVALADDVITAAMLALLSTDGSPPREVRLTMTIVHCKTGWHIASHHGSQNLAFPPLSRALELAGRSGS